jgi:hypothetical protein
MTKDVQTAPDSGRSVFDKLGAKAPKPLPTVSLNTHLVNMIITQDNT